MKPAKSGLFNLMNMGNVLTLREIDLLEFLGFKPEYPDEIDRDYCQYVKKIHHHLLMTGLHIIVSDDVISVWCKEAKGGISGGEFLIISYPFTESRLLFVLGYLTCNSNI